MSLVVIISIISTAIVCVSVIVAILQYRENHRTKVDSDLNKYIRDIAREIVEPVKDQVSSHEIRFSQDGDRLNRIEELLRVNSADLRAALETMTKMGVKVDMYWSSLESMAMNSAKGLHQPDPRRERIDALLEDFMEGTLTEPERIELKKLLVQIRNYEPGGPDLPFPVYPGEHTLAAILLSTMDLVDPEKMAAIGHAAHRSAAHRKVKEVKSD